MFKKKSITEFSTVAILSMVAVLFLLFLLVMTGGKQAYGESPHFIKLSNSNGANTQTGTKASSQKKDLVGKKRIVTVCNINQVRKSPKTVKPILFYAQVVFSSPGIEKKSKLIDLKVNCDLLKDKTKANIILKVPRKKTVMSFIPDLVSGKSNTITLRKTVTHCKPKDKIVTFVLDPTMTKLGVICGIPKRPSPTEIGGGTNHPTTNHPTTTPTPYNTGLEDKQQNPQNDPLKESAADQCKNGACDQPSHPGGAGSGSGGAPSGGYGSPEDRELNEYINSLKEKDDKQQLALPNDIKITSSGDDGGVARDTYVDDGGEYQGADEYGNEVYSSENEKIPTDNETSDETSASTNQGGDTEPVDDVVDYAAWDNGEFKDDLLTGQSEDELLFDGLGLAEGEQQDLKEVGFEEVDDAFFDDLEKADWMNGFTKDELVSMDFEEVKVYDPTITRDRWATWKQRFINPSNFDYYNDSQGYSQQDTTKTQNVAKQCHWYSCWWYGTKNFFVKLFGHDRE